MYKSLVILLVLFVSFLFTGFGIKTGIFIRISDFFFVLFFLIWIINVSKSKLHSVRYFAIGNLPFWIYIVLTIYIILSAFFLNTYIVALKELIQRIQFLLVFIFLIRFLENYSEREKFLEYFLWALFTIAFCTMIIHFAMGHFKGFKEFNEPKYTFGLCSLVSVYFVFYGGRRSLSWIFLMCFSFGMMIISGERQGWIAFLMAIFVTSFSLKGVVKYIIAHAHQFFAGLIIVILLIFLGMQNEYVSKQVNSIGNIISIIGSSDIDYTMGETRSNQARLFLYITGINLFFQNPIFGLGTERFKEYLTTLDIESWLVHGIHSEYLRMLVENGLIGLGLFLLLLWVSFRKLSEIRIFCENSTNLRFHFYIVKAIFVYGSTANLFLGGGALNLLYYLLPIALILSIDYETRVSRMKPL